jgi:hypothetical protein
MAAKIQVKHPKEAKNNLYQTYLSSLIDLLKERWLKAVKLTKIYLILRTKLWILKIQTQQLLVQSI